MKRFLNANEQIQLSNEVSALMEAIVLSVQDAEKHPWENTVAMFEEIVGRHTFTGVFHAANPTALILWNTGFLLIKTLEASPYDPNLWVQVWKPFNDLSQRLGVDASKEFMLANENDVNNAGTE